MTAAVTRGTRWLLILTGGVVVLAVSLYFTILEVRKSSISSAIKSSKKVILYEGLPHQHSERELLESERKARKTVELHEFPFYEDRPELKEDDSKQLTALLTSASTLKRWRGEKSVGVFIPTGASIGRMETRFAACWCASVVTSSSATRELWGHGSTLVMGEKSA